MKTFYTFIFSFIAFTSSAQFSGAYAPSKWTTALSPGSNGTVNTSGAPASIVITGSDGAQSTNVNTDYTVKAIATGVWTFHWAYHTNDSDLDPQYDLAGVLINGAFTQLSDNLGAIDQSGTFSQSVTAGSTIGFRIQATDNIFGNATFTISSFSPPGGVLPLSLTSFTAKPQQQNVVLNWTSASEQNFSHFVLQRSADGISFAPLETIASNTSGRYSFVDQQPVAGVSYYRLQMVDRDGQYTYSPVIAVNSARNVEGTVFPNPARNTISVHLFSEEAKTEKLSVCAVSGAILKTESVQLQRGIVTKQLDISGLPKGVYYIHLDSSQATLSFVKQ